MGVVCYISETVFRKEKAQNVETESQSIIGIRSNSECGTDIDHDYVSG